MKEFARNIKMEAEFPNSQRNMLYRKRAFSGSCAAQQQTEKYGLNTKRKDSHGRTPGLSFVFLLLFFPFFLAFQKDAVIIRESE